jgi:hypothetical protein
MEAEQTPARLALTSDVHKAHGKDVSGWSDSYSFEARVLTTRSWPRVRSTSGGSRPDSLRELGQAALVADLLEIEMGPSGGDGEETGL